MATPSDTEARKVLRAAADHFEEAHARLGGEMYPDDLRAYADELPEAAPSDTDRRTALFEAIANRLGEHPKAGNHEVADSGEYETKLNGRFDVEALAEYICPAVWPMLATSQPVQVEVTTGKVAELEELARDQYESAERSFDHVQILRDRIARIREWVGEHQEHEVYEADSTQPEECTDECIWCPVVAILEEPEFPAAALGGGE